MRKERLTQVLLVVLGLLLAANVMRPAATPTPAFAQASETGKGGIAITGSGQTAWLVKDDKVYYIKFEQQFESIRIYGPEKIDD